MTEKTSLYLTLKSRNHDEGELSNAAEALRAEIRRAGFEIEDRAAVRARSIEADLTRSVTVGVIEGVAEVIGKNLPKLMGTIASWLRTRDLGGGLKPVIEGDNGSEQAVDPTDDPEEQSERLQRRLTKTSTRRALLVGSFDTGGNGELATLQYPLNDAVKLGRLLKDPLIGGFDEPVICTDDKNQATAWNVQHIDGAAEFEIRLLAMLKASSPSDLLLMYYSGHGFIGGAQNKEKTYYLSAGGADLDSLASTAVSISRIRELCNESSIQNTVLIIDACFSGMAIDQANAAYGNVELTRATADSSLTVLTASSAIQVSKEVKNLEMGLYTHHLCHGLESGTIRNPNQNVFDITIGDIQAHMERELEGSQQVPCIWPPKAPGSGAVIATNRKVRLLGELATVREKLAELHKRRLVSPRTWAGLDALLANPPHGVFSGEPLPKLFKTLLRFKEDDDLGAVQQEWDNWIVTAQNRFKSTFDEIESHLTAGRREDAIAALERHEQALAESHTRASKAEMDTAIQGHKIEMTLVEETLKAVADQRQVAERRRHKEEIAFLREKAAVAGANAKQEADRRVAAENESVGLKKEVQSGIVEARKRVDTALRDRDELVNKYKLEAANERENRERMEKEFASRSRSRREWRLLRLPPTAAAWANTLVVMALVGFGAYAITSQARDGAAQRQYEKHTALLKAQHASAISGRDNRIALLLSDLETAQDKAVTAQAEAAEANASYENQRLVTAIADCDLYAGDWLDPDFDGYAPLAFDHHGNKYLPQALHSCRLAAEESGIDRMRYQYARALITLQELRDLAEPEGEAQRVLDAVARLDSEYDTASALRLLDSMPDYTAAITLLALVNREGTLGAIDETTAVALYQEAASSTRRHGPAANQLAYLYRNPKSFQRDRAKQQEYEARAADYGYPQAMYSGGVELAGGLRVGDPDTQAGFNLITRAASSGHVPAVEWLANQLAETLSVDITDGVFDRQYELLRIENETP